MPPRYVVWRGSLQCCFSNAFSQCSKELKVYFSADIPAAIEWFEPMMMMMMMSSAWRRASSSINSSKEESRGEQSMQLEQECA